MFKKKVFQIVKIFTADDFISPSKMRMQTGLAIL